MCKISLQHGPRQPTGSTAGKDKEPGWCLQSTPLLSVPHRARWQRRMGSMLSLPSLKQVLKKGQYLSAETW